MILLSRKIDYALLLLCYLRHHPEGACARILADRFALGQPFVAKILKLLCRKQFVSSQRGVKGGYVLLPGVAQRSLADLLDAFDDHLFLAECNRATPDVCCSIADHCPIRDPIAEVYRRLRDVLTQVTLAELFESGATVSRLQLDTSRVDESTLAAAMHPAGACG